MTASPARAHLVSPEEYLEEEPFAELKHEFLNGVVYAMAGGSVVHNRVAINLLAALKNRLRGGPCEPFGSDMRLRVQRADDLRFYYPDGQVVCDSPGAEQTYQENPILLIEVISESTRRTDEGEKKDAYLLLPSLQAYLLVETEQPLVVVLRRGPGGFVREAAVGLLATVPLPWLDTELPLQEIYERVEFPDAEAAR